jgi:hypothetical protein
MAVGGAGGGELSALDLPEWPTHHAPPMSTPITIMAPATDSRYRVLIEPPMIHDPGTLWQCAD